MRQNHGSYLNSIERFARFSASAFNFIWFQNLIPFNLTGTHRKTLTSIFDKPTPKNLEWKTIESLFVALGCSVVDGRGSRVRFAKGNIVACFHRPHPEKEAKPYQVVKSREFLEKIGVKP